VSGTRVRLGLYHPRGLMCERGGACGPFRVADKLVSEICRTCVWCVYTVVLDIVSGTDTVLYCIWRSL